MFRSPIRLILLLAMAPLSLAAVAQQATPPQTDGQTNAPTSPAPATQGTPAASSDSQQNQQQPADGAQTNALPDDPATAAHVSPPVEPEGPTAVFDTSMGRMVCRLYSKEAPQTVANFIGLATGTKQYTDRATHKKITGKPFYDGTTFHRVIPGFMIQGGDPTATGTGDPGYFFADEIVPTLTFDVPGRLAMANAGPNTNGSQFFITVTPQPSLDQHYSIFGQCDSGSVLVASAITQVPRNGQDKPLDPVYLNKLTIVPNGKPLPAVPPPAASQPAPTAPQP